MKKRGTERPEIKVDLPADYELEAGEADDLAYLTFKYGAGWAMRSADLAVVNLMRDRKLRGVDAVRDVVKTTAEYAWDHILGKPRRPTPSSIYHHMAPGVIEWYAKTTPQERRATK